MRMTVPAILGALTLGLASFGCGPMPQNANDLGNPESLDQPQAPGAAVKAAPALSSLAPVSGGTDREVIALIQGSGFSAGAVRVYFGGTESPEVRIVNDTMLTAVVPPGAPGTVDVVVEVRVADATFRLISPRGYTYVEVPKDPNPATTTPSDPPPPPVGADGDDLPDAVETGGWQIQVDYFGFGLAEPHVVRYSVTSDPNLTDTDGDGLSDFEEYHYKSDPRLADTDKDGLWDGEEVNRWGTSPVSVDTDGDSRSPDPSSSVSTLPPNAQFFDGLELYAVDELAKTPALRGEVKVDATAPDLDDTDGDNVRDSDESGSPVRTPLLADMPQLKFEIVDDVDIRLDVEYAEEEGRTTSIEQSFSTATSSTTSSSQSNTVSASVTVGVEVGFGLLEFGGGNVEVSAGYEHSWESTQESSVESEQSFAQAEENSRTKTETSATGSMTAGVRITNVGNIAVTLSDIGYTVRQWFPNANSNLGDTTPGEYKTFATLLPVRGADGITLAPGADSGIVQFQATELNADRVKAFLARPGAMQVAPAAFEMQNADGINFAFIEEVTQAQTARLTIDFGNGVFENYRIATNVERNADGSLAGVPLTKALDLTVGADNWTEQPTDPNQPSAVTPVTVVNGSFENPQYFDSQGAPAGWAGSGLAIWAGHFTPAPAPDGTQWLQVPPGLAVYQQIGSVSAAGNYTISFIQALQVPAHTSSVSVQLYAGNPGSGGTLMTAQSFFLNSNSPYTPRTVTLRNGAAFNAFAGQPLYLRLAHDGGSGSVILDSLTVTVESANPLVVASIRGVATQLDSTPQFWSLFRAGEGAGSTLESTRLMPGDTVLLALSKDQDGDGLYSAQEQQYGSSDTLTDSDGDTVPDPIEAARRYKNQANGQVLDGGWTVTVTRRDGSSSSRRVFSDPRLRDSDGDGRDDAWERSNGTDPNTPDTDGDGISDLVDPYPKQQAIILYVNAAATGGNNGLSWASAYTQLHSAITDARARNGNGSGADDVGEIWVAQGVYRPSAGNRFDSAARVTLYGGFSGGETRIGQRNPDGTTNGTSLQPSQAGMYIVYVTDDGFTIDGFTLEGASGSTNALYFGQRTGTARNCFFFNNNCTYNGAAVHGAGSLFTEGGTWTLDRCTFASNRTTAINAHGGAAYFYKGTPVLLDCYFVANACDSTSGTITSGGAVTIERCGRFLASGCIFESNQLLSNGVEVAGRAFGGGLALYGSSSIDMLGSIDACEFRLNEVEDAAIAGAFLETRAGGGLGVYSNTANFGPKVNVTNCVFWANKAFSFGGGAYIGTNANARLLNCSFNRNQVVPPRGGPWNCYPPGYDWRLIDNVAVGAGLGVSGRADAINCVAFNNFGTDSYRVTSNGGSVTSTHQVGEEEQMSTTPSGWQTSPCIPAAGTLNISYCNVEKMHTPGITYYGNVLGLGNIGADPGFTNESTGNLKLGAGSPCIDAGNRLVDADITVGGFQSLVDYDLFGDPRLVDGDGNGEAELDIGAYEFQP